MTPPVFLSHSERMRGIFPEYDSTRIPQSNQKCRKRGGILEQRRRPIVKSQSDFALSHDVAMRLKRPLEAPLSDRCSEAQTNRLRCGRIVPRTSCPIATAESGLNGAKRLKDLNFDY